MTNQYRITSVVIAALVILTDFPCSTEILSASQPNQSTLAVGTDVAITTRSGQIIRGKVDARSSDAFLWLSTIVEDIRIASRTSMAEITDVRIVDAIVLPPMERTASTTRIQSRNDMSTRVVSLEAQSQLANWDYDAAPDGLILHLAPLNNSGHLVPVSGTVSATLTVYTGDGRQRSADVKTESWTLPVKSQDFTQQGAQVHLPFQQIQPTVDTGIQPFGDLQIRLNIPGRGVVETQINGVCLRPYSPTRDLRTFRGMQ